MKRLLLLGLSFGMAASSWAQLSWGTHIGQTYYDLHSNSSTGNRLVRNDDGSMSATWIEHWDFLTTANEPKPAVRGFGYNHYDPTTASWTYGTDGECWEDPFGCASSYVGWPEMINMSGATWDNEIIINHTPLKMTKRAAIGSGNWSNTATLGIEGDLGQGSWDGTWPRAVSSGNTIHLIVTSTDPNETGFFDQSGVEMPCVYMKSDDGGATWTTAYSFDVSGVVPDTTITPNVSYDTTGTAIDTINSMDTICSTDTITTGAFTVSTDTVGYNADVPGSAFTLTIADTTFNVDWLNVAGDTVATIEGCYDTAVVSYDTTLIIDTIVTFDTTFGTQTVNLVEIVGADAYAMHANGNTVAVTFGAGHNNDWFLFKSTDNGNTWTRKTVRDNHNLAPAFLGQDGNGYITNADNFDVVVDDAGMVHVFAGMDMLDNQFIYSDPDLYKDAGAGIMYWNDGMAEGSASVVGRPHFGEDPSADTSTWDITGTARYGAIFLQGWPAAAVDNNGGVYLMYSAIAENTEFINQTTADTVGFMDLYMVYSKDNGATWECMDDPINIAEDVFSQIGATPTQDDLFPVAVPEIASDGIMHFTWQGDWSQPGLALSEDTHPNDNLNYIHYAGMNISGLTAGACDAPIPPVLDAVNELKTQIGFRMVPNPAKDIVTVSADEAISAVSVVNMMGQTVKTVSVNGQFSKTIEVADLTKGIYVVRVETAAGTATEKLEIVK